MKKNLVALLLVLAVVSVGVFAGPTVDPAKFDLKTTVNAINQMKFTAAAQSTKDEFIADTKDLTGGVAVGTDPADVVKVDGNFYNVAYISTMSNYRKGFQVDMKVEAMKSTLEGINNYINYTVMLDTDEGTETTTNDGTPVQLNKVIDNTAGFSTLTFNSRLVKVKINKDQFDNAVQGEYTGTVTFSWTSK